MNFLFRKSLVLVAQGYCTPSKVFKGAPFGNQNAAKNKLYRGVGEGSSRSGDMTWVTPDQDIAQGYANRRAGGRVEEVSADIKNTFDVGHDTRELTPSQFAIQAMTKAKATSPLTDKEMLALRSAFVKDLPPTATKVSDFWADDAGKKRVASLLLGLGFDSLQLLEEGKPTYGLLKKSVQSIAGFQVIFKGAPLGNQNACKNKPVLTGLTGERVGHDPDRTFDGRSIPTFTVSHIQGRIRELTDKGIAVGYTPDEFHSATKGRVDPVDMVKAIWGESEYRKNEIADASISPHDGGEGYEHLKGRVSFSGAGTVHGSKVSWVERNLSSDMQSIDHTFLEMHKGQSNKGAVRSLFSKSVPLYKKMGLKAITVHANLEAGAYAWTKFGFTTDEPERLKSMVEAGWAKIVKQANSKVPREDRLPLSPEAKKEVDGLREVLDRGGKYLGMNLSNLKTPHLDEHFGHVYAEVKDRRIPDTIPMSFIKTAMSGTDHNATHRFDDPLSTKQLASYLSGST